MLVLSVCQRYHRVLNRHAADSVERIGAVRREPRGKPSRKSRFLL